MEMSLSLPPLPLIKIYLVNIVVEALMRLWLKA
jgi:hypothetical protein